MMLTRLIRPDLQNFEPYGSARRQDTTGRLWLNANESPWNHHFLDNPDILLNRYPNPQPIQLIEKLSKFYQTQPQNMLITRGSDEAIDLLIRLFCTTGEDGILICPPTFGMYEVCARIQGAFTLSIPLNKAKDFQLDMSAIKSSWHPKVKLIFLCSPNNPTGNLINEADILDLCTTFFEKSLIVVDEAYIEYSQRDSLIQKISSYENLVILRTFSKALGCAGIRCGSLIAQESIIQWLNKIIMPYPIPVMTEHLACQALQADTLKENLAKVHTIRSEKIRLYNYLSNHPCVRRIWPSEANFILMETQDAAVFKESCLKNGIVVRQIKDQWELKNSIRISIGLPDENTQLIEVLEKI